MSDLSHFGLGLAVPFITPDSECFRPPSWPPPKDWAWVTDKAGNVVSRYGDPILDLTPWLGTTKTFNFGDGPKKYARSRVIDPANADLLRLLVAYRGWGPRAASAPRTLLQIAMNFSQIVAVCSDNNILASELSRYPAVIDRVAEALPRSSYDIIIAELERLRDARDFLGFELLDREGIQRLKALQPPYDREQTEYIPPRIWTYIVTRVASCIKDYRDHQAEIEACFAFCVNAYAQNGVSAYRERSGKTQRHPFRVPPVDCTGMRSGITYYGSFADTAQCYGIKDVIERWVGPLRKKRGIAAFTNYLQLIQHVSIIDIAAFTLMRIEEAASVRWDCLQWHDDPVFGRIPLIRSETTKTDPDGRALWITSPSIEPSVHALQSITKMRLTSAGRWVEGDNPRLITAALEPWGGGRVSAMRVDVTPTVYPLSGVVSNFQLQFDPQHLTITEKDLKIARAVCPTLNAKRFQVGMLWPLAWHQFRRTGAVNMFASGEISDSSMQLQMKHLTRLQPLYYGRGNTALHLNDAARVLLINAQYEAMGRELAAMCTDRFVSPHGDEHKARLFAPANDGEPVNLISEGDAKHYAKVYRQHLVGGRLTVLGACMKNGPCDGDCVSSVGDCAGGDGKAPCTHVLFDQTRAPANQTRLKAVTKQLEATHPDTPRYRHLEQEKRGLENYFAYIRKTA